MGSGSSRKARASTARVTTARVTTARPAADRSLSAPVDLTQPRSAAGVRFRPEYGELAEEIPDCDLGESLDGSDAVLLFSELQSHSAQSTESGDSGICDLEAEYGHVITETSAVDRVAQVEREFLIPLNLELEVVGRAVPRLLSGYQKSRREEQQILKSLREEGLIATQAERVSSGVSFQIVAASEEAAPAPAARLPSATLDRLEARRHRHRRTLEPESDQLVKQRRRREAEEEKLRKLMLRKQQIEQHQQQAEEHRQLWSEDKEAKMERRVGSAMDKRQRHLNDLRQRLRDKHERVKQVPLEQVPVT